MLGSRWGGLLLLALLAVAGCQKADDPEARRAEAERLLASGPRPETHSANLPRPPDDGLPAATVPTAPLDPAKLVAVQWSPLYVSDKPVDRNVFLETVKADSAAAALILADRVACLGELVGPGSGFGMLPKQAVVWAERDPALKRRVIVEARVACRQGYLEHLLSQFEAGKDHESALSGTFDSQSIHLGLLACGLKPGRPAQFVNDKQEEHFTPPTGEPVRVDVEYAKAGHWVRHPAQRFVLRKQADKPLDLDWIYTGSFVGEFENDEGKPQKYFAANTGRVICVTNFAAALLDLPTRTAQGSPDDGGLDFVANTAEMPARHTPVRVILEKLK